jgi:L-seryl-tRNA(Ser) seleniumtransferase
LIVYDSLGVRRVINADTTLTRLGGSLIPKPGLEVMKEAAASFVDMFELQQQVGRRLAALTHVESLAQKIGVDAGQTHQFSQKMSQMYN